MSAELISSLPERLRPRQRVFDRTGGLHAAGLFDLDGTPLVVREDIGRHNAVDKVVGWALMARRLPLHECVLAISGRAGFEIAQKAVAAGDPGGGLGLGTLQPGRRPGPRPPPDAGRVRARGPADRLLRCGAARALTARGGGYTGQAPAAVRVAPWAAYADDSV